MAAFLFNLCQIPKWAILSHFSENYRLHIIENLPSSIGHDIVIPCSKSVHIFRVFRLHSLQRACGPVPRIWLTPSNWMSGSCDIKPDAALGDEIRSDRWKPTRAYRRNTRGLCDLSSLKQRI
ncbi:hypothetical protein T12_11356 [Trichinella patagoniensis]|uniref:Uncharacterized protein n=1 Tax=Trichinella patagoniensis TaxID=990121 RepID=A0A0V0ZJG4_9BILA|nr:hypothetical protein T12_11356 [Trichinella patagoniensis]